MANWFQYIAVDLWKEIGDPETESKLQSRFMMTYQILDSRSERILTLLNYAAYCQTTSGFSVDHGLPGSRQSLIYTLC